MSGASLRQLAAETYRAPTGTTQRLASVRVVGHMFQENRKPSRSSPAWKFQPCSAMAAGAVPGRQGVAFHWCWCGRHTGAASWAAPKLREPGSAEGSQRWVCGKLCPGSGNVHLPSPARVADRGVPASCAEALHGAHPSASVRVVQHPCLRICLNSTSCCL